MHVEGQGAARAAPSPGSREVLRGAFPPGEVLSPIQASGAAGPPLLQLSSSHRGGSSCPTWRPGSHGLKGLGLGSDPSSLLPSCVTLGELPTP